jgi:hypothetical protein
MVKKAPDPGYGSSTKNLSIFNTDNCLGILDLDPEDQNTTFAKNVYEIVFDFVYFFYFLNSSLQKSCSFDKKKILKGECNDV